MTRLPPVLRPAWPYAKRAYTFLTGAVAPFTMRLDNARNGWLPRAVAASTADALARPGNGAAHLVADAEVVERPAPTGVPDRIATFQRQARAVFRPQQVLELRHGRVLGPHRALITRDGTLLHDEVRYFGTNRGAQHPVFLHLRADPPVEVDGEVAVLASRGDSNYYHFLHDVVPRLSVLERWAAPDAPDLVYVPAATSFQQEILAMLGIGSDRVIDADKAPHLRATRLIVPTVPDLDLNHPAWAVEFLRDRLLPPSSPGPHRRIYVTRGRSRHTRIVNNEDEVCDALIAYGFETVDPGSLTVAEQICLFAEAKTIVAPHGAALTNLAFASPGASVVELFAPDFVQGCYWKLSTCIPDLTYRYFVGRGRSTRLRDTRGVSSDIEVDVQSLVHLVGPLLS